MGFEQQEDRRFVELLQALVRGLLCLLSVATAIWKPGLVYVEIEVSNYDGNIRVSDNLDGVLKTQYIGSHRTRTADSRNSSSHVVTWKKDCH